MIPKPNLSPPPIPFSFGLHPLGQRARGQKAKSSSAHSMYMLKLLLGARSWASCQAPG